MKKIKYTNRYGDVFTFTKQEDGNILWEGNFEFHRYGWANNPDGTTNKDIIDMVDPSGGPYISAHMDLEKIFNSEEFKGLCVRKFTKIDTGYLIHTYDKFAHLADWNIIGGII